MMELVYYTPNKLMSYDDIRGSDPVQASFLQMFNSSISLMDRTHSINCPPVPVTILDPMPTTWIKPSRSFEEICSDRYQAILDQALSSGKKLVIFYSGGIDSTLIAALAIAHPEFSKHKDDILLAFSEDSITENPNFWYDYLLPTFGHRLLSASAYHAHITNPSYLCLTGEFADNIFGSLTLKSYMDATGDFNAIHKPFTSTGRYWMLKKIANQAHRDECVELLTTVLNTAPISMVSNHDCFWWLNFVLKWQAVKFRLSSHAPSPALTNAMAKNVIHFFETSEFQHWAVMTDETKVENDWYSYKLPAKKVIFGINGDRQYLDKKTKYPSIPSLTRYANTHDFIYLDRSSGEYIASKELIR